MTSEFRAFVFAYLPDEVEAVPAGQLAVVEEGQRVIASRFGFGAGYLRRPKAIPLDAASLSLNDAVPGTVREQEPANALDFFGVIRDAMPDLWGRRVIENMLNAPPASLPESRYLLEAGSNRFGALDVRSTLQSSEAGCRQIATNSSAAWSSISS